MLDAVRMLKRKGRAHRDIKSDNILLSGALDEGGHPSDLALADFGEAGPLQLEWFVDGSVSHGGALQAIAPEVLAGRALQGPECVCGGRQYTCSINLSIELDVSCCTRVGL